MSGHVRIERDLVGAVTAAPEPVAVSRLIHRDAINPGTQRRLPAKTANGAKDSEENLLGEIERFVAVAKQVHRHLDDHALVLGDELREGNFVAGRATLNQGS